MTIPCVWLRLKESKGLAQGHPATKSTTCCPGTPSGLTSSFAPSGVARILTHEAGITDVVVLQVTFLLLCQEAGEGGSWAPSSSGHPLAGVTGLSGSLFLGSPAP